MGKPSLIGSQEIENKLMGIMPVRIILKISKIRCYNIVQPPTDI